MNRCTTLLLFGLTIVMGLPVPFSPSAPFTIQAAEVADLKTQLENDLKCRRPEEFAFVALVIAKVDAKQLPLDLVKSTFLWARTQQPRPYQFFERGLRVRAARLGISL